MHSRASYQSQVPSYIFEGAKRIFLPGAGEIRYDELTDGSPEYMLSHGSSKITRTYVCKWEDRQNFCRAMLGYPRIRTTTHPGALAAGVSFFGAIGDKKPAPPPNDYEVVRVIPHAITDLVDPTGGESFMYAMQVTSLKGAGPKGTYDEHEVPEYHFAVVVVQYEPVTFKVATDEEVRRAAEVDGDDFRAGVERDRFITKLRKPSAEYISLPRGLYKWAPANGEKPTVDFASSRLLPSMELIYHWHAVPFLPTALFRGYVGSVNKDIFRDTSLANLSKSSSIPRDPHARTGYAPGTLLLLSAEVKPYRTAVGAFVHDITYRMKYYEPEPGRGHNFFLRYDNATNRLFYVKITDTGGNDEAAVIIPDKVIGGLAPGAGAINYPYPAASLPFAAGNARAVYPYKNFYNLFAFNTDDVS